MKISDIVEFLNEVSPFSAAESFDNVGLITGDEDEEVTAVCCCLDITREVIKEAAEKNANLIVSHHPVIFNGLKTIPKWSPVRALIEKNIAAVACHTNFDIAENGVNDALCELLGFEKKAVLEITQKDGKGFGAVCDVPLSFTPKALAEHCKNVLYLESAKYSRLKVEINRVAVCCGAGVDEKVMELARKAGCDAVISGDIKHNFWIEALNCGLALIDAGHFGTEKCAPHRLAAMITKKFPQIPIFASEKEEEPAEYV